MMKARTTQIRVLEETWHVPRGFGAAYRRVLKDHFALIEAGEPGKLIFEVVDLLALIGYAVTAEQVADWNLRKRVEAVIYAATEYARASDNPVQRYPLPSWLPERPWQGPPADVSRIRAGLRGAFEGPGGTPIMALTDERMKELRFEMWTLARDVLTDTANTRAAMPGLLDEEYAYAREFMLGIAKLTRPGAYVDDDEDPDAVLVELQRKRTSLCEEFAYAGPGENPWRSRIVVELAGVDAQIAKLKTEIESGGAR